MLNNIIINDNANYTYGIISILFKKNIYVLETKPVKKYQAYSQSK